MMNVYLTYFSFWSISILIWMFLKQKRRYKLRSSCMSYLITNLNFFPAPYQLDYLFFKISENYRNRKIFFMCNGYRFKKLDFGSTLFFSYVLLIIPFFIFSPFIYF